MASVSIAQPDVTLHLDTRGIIREAALAESYSAESVESWIGRPWIETVGSLGSDKVKRIIEDACAKGVSAFRQVTQCFPSGLELPMEYTAVRLGDSGLVAVGKNLQAVAELQSRLVAAQFAMERDYWKLRDVETRYRTLFDASNDAVVVVRVSDLHVVEANPAAIRALGISPIGQSIVAELPPEEREPFQAMLANVREHGRAPATVVHVGPDREAWAVRASMTTGDAGRVFLLQVTRAGLPPPRAGGNAPVSYDGLMERAPDSFVIVDADGAILRANQAFLELVQAAGEMAVVGQSLRRWLSRPGADLKILMASISANGSVRLFPTVITGELGTETEVEISGMQESGPQSHTGILIRDVSRRIPAGRVSDHSGSALPQLAGAVGARPLHELVRHTTELVERHYIDAALSQTGNNRTAAAELLGLSRQSLYVKLNRYKNEAARQPV